MKKSYQKKITTVLLSGTIIMGTPFITKAANLIPHSTIYINSFVAKASEITKDCTVKFNCKDVFKGHDEFKVKLRVTEDDSSYDSDEVSDKDFGQREVIVRKGSSPHASIKLPGKFLEDKEEAGKLKWEITPVDENNKERMADIVGYLQPKFLNKKNVFRFSLETIANPRVYVEWKDNINDYSSRPNNLGMDLYYDKGRVQNDSYTEDSDAFVPTENNSSFTFREDFGGKIKSDSFEVVKDETKIKEQKINIKVHDNELLKNSNYDAIIVPEKNGMVHRLKLVKLYNINVKSNDINKGTLNGDININNVKFGTKFGDITLPKPVAKKGYKFVGWTLSGTMNPSNVNANGLPSDDASIESDLELTANFASESDISYSVEHHIITFDGTDKLVKTENFTDGVTDEEKEVTPLEASSQEIYGYEFDKSNPNNILKKMIVVDYPKNIFKVYYVPKVVSYSVKYINQEGKQVATEKNVYNKKFGENIEEEAVELPGYKLLDSFNKIKTLTLNLSNNVIEFKYVPSDFKFEELKNIKLKESPKTKYNEFERADLSRLELLLIDKYGNKKVMKYDKLVKKNFDFEIINKKGDRKSINEKLRVDDNKIRISKNGKQLDFNIEVTKRVPSVSVIKPTSGATRIKGKALRDSLVTVKVYRNGSKYTQSTYTSIADEDGFNIKLKFNGKAYKLKTKDKIEVYAEKEGFGVSKTLRFIIK